VFPPHISIAYYFSILSYVDAAGYIELRSS